MDPPAKPKVTQASFSTDFENNAVITASPIVASASHCPGGDGSTPVLVELVRPIPLSSEDSEDIMRLFIRLG